MKRLLFLLVIFMVFKMGAFAQPTIFVPSVSPCVEESPDFCMGITVIDFTDILSTEYSIVWDPAVIAFREVRDFQLPGLSAQNFDLTNVADGILTIKWTFNECSPDAKGVTLEDGQQIYSLCFTALGDYGAFSEVRIGNDPVDIHVTRVNACPNNIGLNTESGVVSTCVRPLRLTASREKTFQGDLVCVDFSVAGFDNLTSVQFSINWDAEILEFANVNVLGNLINLSQSGFGTPADPDIPQGSVTVSWAYVDPNDNSGVTLEDGTTIFQVCYRVKGSCDTSSLIRVSGTPTAIEVTNTVQEGVEIPVLSTPGEVAVGNCDPTGLQLMAGCGDPVSLNDEVCVKVTAAGFQEILEMNYLMKWNPFILEFKEVRNLNSGVVGLGLNDFNRDNAPNGILGLEWKTVANFAQSLPDSALLYEVCFVVVGLGGDSPIRFPPSPATVRKLNAGNIGISPSNCEVRVIQPEGVSVTIGDLDLPVGQKACVDVSVGHFDEIVSAQFSLAWDAAHIRFTEIRDINLPEAGLSDFDLSQAGSGRIAFDWEPSQHYSLPAGQDIFSVCFKGVGSPKDCRPIEIVDLPIKSEVISLASNGNNIGLTGQGGEVCLLNPDGFTLVIGRDEGFLGDTVCVPFKAADFADITSASFPVSWNPSALNLLEIRTNGALGLDTAQHFNTASADVGLLEFSWSDPAGASLADSTVLFEMCFRLLGPKNECHDIILGQGQTVTTAKGEGSILLRAGAVCIKDRFIIENVNIKPVSCPGSDDGEVELTVTGGTGTIFFNWGSTPTQFTNHARDLPEGEVTVTIFDSNDPPLVLTETFLVTQSDDLPFADAGQDRDASCDSEFVLVGKGNTSPGYGYLWSTIGGSLPEGRESLAVAARGAGLYVLTVKHAESQCSASDTVEVFQPAVPFVSAGQDISFDCRADTLRLDGSASEASDTIAYAWTTGGGAIVPGDESLQSPRITAPGVYVMRAFYTTTRCGARDTVVVEDVRVLPDANAGSDQELGCTDDFALLDGSGSVNDASVIYQWEDAQGGLLSNAVSFQAAAAGTYYFRATDTISGCQAVDTALVALSSDFPLIDTGEDLLISCAADTVTVNARVTGVPDFSFEWVSQDSTGSIVPGTEKTLLPRITAPGKYELVVTNTDNGCTSRDTVVVSKEGADYQLSIAASGVLDCTDASVQLEASASEFGPGYAAEWSGLNSQPVEATGNPLIVSVSQAGTYQVLVRDENSGCEFTAEVEVLTDGSLPIADAGGDRFLSCPGEPLFLDGSNSSGSGELSYQWTVLSGDGSVENPNGAVASVTEPGTYQLRVSSGDNGCSALATAVVSLDPALIPAAAGDDAVTCDHGAMLSGNLPPGSTGQWTTATAAAVEDPGQATTFVENLAEGDNLFVWTLSHPNCPDYSSDEVVIAKEPAPVANDDSADLPAGEDRLRINLAANDQFRANSDWIVNIVVAPSLGSIEAVEGGSIDYVANPGDYGIETFTYELCMLDCNLCDTAVVRVNVNLAAVSSGDFPNAITPNGDGVNDELVFPLLVNAFDSWPDNQLIIFNRWGNVVYEAKPYSNNWQGENSNGQQLPDGTYYYVLRLDISNGVIYKGDITILNGQNR